MRPRKTLVAALFALAISCLVWTLSQTEIGQIFEFKTLDYRFRLRPIEPVAPQLLVVAIDDQSLDFAGRWPWPRDYHAQLLQIMSEQKPKAVGFDMFFSEPEKRDETGGGDALLAQEARAIGNVVFGAVARQTVSQSAVPPPDLSTNALLHFTGELNAVIGSDDVQLPLPALREVAACGFINAEREADGVLRRLSLVVRVGDRLYPSLVLRSICISLGVPLQEIEVNLGDNVILRRHSELLLEIPIDERGRYWINYRHRPGDFARLDGAVNFLTVIQSFAQSSGGKPVLWPLARLKDKIVLVGLSATGLDVAPTPLYPNTPLVFAQADAIGNILQRDFLRPMPALVFWPLMSLGMLALALCNIHAGGAVRSAFLSVLWIVVYAGIVWTAFAYASVWLEFFWPVIGLGLIFSSVTAYQFFTTEREKREIKQAFQHYLSPNVMAEVLQDPHKLVLGGVRRKITVLFSDIRGFTAYSEKRPPEEVVPVLNQLQDELSKVIWRHDGTLDKYMGDAIMAFWGAPGEPKADDALHAVRCAHEMVATLNELGTKWRAKGIEPFGIGVGINTGYMIVGNMGSTVLFNYTVIGDEANLGARLESLTRQFDANVILSEATYREVESHVHARELGEVTVKGKARPVRIFALDGLNSQAAV